MTHARHVLVGITLGMFLLATAGAAQPRSPAEWLKWFSATWDDDTWTSPRGSRKYMRPNQDVGWKARMRALQGLVSAGPGANDALTAALSSQDAPTRALAAQASGYVGSQDLRPALLERLKIETDAAVRLYLVDSLGMIGGQDLSTVLSATGQDERNGDVRKHMQYAKLRGLESVPADIVSSLCDWNAESMNTAELGKSAPDFTLPTIAGRSIRLSDFRGKQAVVLVFIYGDT